jgi:hypothetical protein
MSRHKVMRGAQWVIVSTGTMKHYAVENFMLTLPGLLVSGDQLWVKELDELMKRYLELLLRTNISIEIISHIRDSRAASCREISNVQTKIYWPSTGPRGRNISSV